MASPVHAALEGLLDRFVQAHRCRHGRLPAQAFDREWISPCQAGEPDAGGRIAWRPVPRRPPVDFSGLERALDAGVHADVKAYYGSFWCDSFEARADEGGLTLIQVWNERDFDRLIENLLGHHLLQRRGRMETTLFFACTDQEDFNLGVDNASGRVVLERPGERPVKTVSPSLAEFLARVQPKVD